MHSISVVVSSTSTLVGACIRRVTGERYNHVSFFLDNDSDTLYSFARKYKRNILSARFITESIDRLTANGEIPIGVFTLDITDEEYQAVLDIIGKLKTSRHAFYNYIGLFLLIFNKGFKTNSIFVCSTFVAYTLENALHYKLPKPFYLVKPMDFVSILSEYKVYEGSSIYLNSLITAK